MADIPKCLLYDNRIDLSSIREGFAAHIEELVTAPSFGASPDEMLVPERVRDGGKAPDHPSFRGAFSYVLQKKLGAPAHYTEEQLTALDDYFLTT